MNETSVQRKTIAVTVATFIACGLWLYYSAQNAPPTSIYGKAMGMPQPDVIVYPHISTITPEPTKRWQEAVWQAAVLDIAAQKNLDIANAAAAQREQARVVNDHEAFVDTELARRRANPIPVDSIKPGTRMQLWPVIPAEQGGVK